MSVITSLCSDDVSASFAENRNITTHHSTVRTYLSALLFKIFFNVAHKLLLDVFTFFIYHRIKGKL